MERAAFKFTSEYLEVLGGKDSPMYEEFIEMFCKGLAAARKYATVTITMLEIMMFQVDKKRVSIGRVEGEFFLVTKKTFQPPPPRRGTCEWRFDDIT